MWVDGGLATTLQAVGLPPFRPVEPWVHTHPDEVRTAQRAFVDAGAEILLTATFRAYPSVTPDWRRTVPAAIALAREAAAGRAQVWLSLGPPEDDTPQEHEAAVLQLGLDHHVDGVVLETRTDPRRTVQTVRALRRRWRGPLVASLVPRADGRLLRGDEPQPWLDELLEAGADGAGFNCGSGPKDVVAAVQRVRPESLWTEVAGGDPDETVDALVALSGVSRWCGGCCGVTPTMLSQAVARAR